MNQKRSVELAPAAAAVRQPWKNGRGFTDVLAVWPRGASSASADFDARISVATVAESGPFSSFAGFERVLVVTAGEGLVLSHGDDAPRARLRRLEPYRFSGDWTTRAELLGAPIRDFNVFARRGPWSSEVQAVALGRRRLREPLDAPHAFLHVVSGALVARLTGEEAPFELGARDSLRIDHARGPDELEVVGGEDETVLLLVRLRDRPR